MFPELQKLPPLNCARMRICRFSPPERIVGPCRPPKHPAACPERAQGPEGGIIDSQPAQSPNRLSAGGCPRGKPDVYPNRTLPQPPASPGGRFPGTGPPALGPDSAASPQTTVSRKHPSF